MRYPDSWQIGSCDSCADPTAPSVFVNLYNPATGDKITVDPLDDKPAATPADQWLAEVSRTTVDNPRASQEWITINGSRALRVINNNPDSTQSENIYLLKGVKTFAIRTNWGADSQQLLQRIISTFRFASG